MTVSEINGEALRVEVAVDETTALLGTPTKTDGDGVTTSDQPCPRGNCDDYADDDSPLPLTQIFLLCYVRLIDPIAYFAIFPFINKMIVDTGDVEEVDVGFYSGMIESLFSATQMLFMVFWGRLSDKYGRKPVLVFSLIGLTITSSLFGASKKVWQMILFRCLAGTFAGTIVTVRTMITENSTSKTQARAFSYFSFSGNLGILIGPLIGGGLSNPAEQYPKVFGHVQLFKDFPYLLPTIVCGALSISMTILGALFIRETLHLKDDKESVKREPMSILELVRSSGVAMVLCINCHIMLLGFAYTAVLPVFWFTDSRFGGLGFTPFQISLFLGIVGISQALWLLLIFPPLQRRIGTGGVLRGCTTSWPFMLLFAPLCNSLLRWHWNTAFWVMTPTVIVIGSGVSMAFTASQLALNDIAPTPSTLGTLNAFSLTLTSGIRMVAPATFSSIFAAGAKMKFLGGYLIWVVLILLAIPLIVLVRRLPAKAEGKVRYSRDESEGGK